jgi:hypothetical protein
MSLLKLDLLYAIAIFLIAIFAPEANAFTCVSGATVGSRVTVTVINSATPCAAGTYAILTPAEVTSYTNAVATVATQATIITNLENKTVTQATTITALQTALTTVQTDVAALQAGGGGGTPAVPFDPVLGGAFWSFAMTFVFGCWLLAKNAGMILQAIKRF